MIFTSLRLKEFKNYLDVIIEYPAVEFRLDGLNLNDLPLIEKAFKLPGIIKLAVIKEDDSTLTSRLLSSAIHFGADYIDIDADFNSDLTNELIIEARSKNVKVISSYHNYEKVPDMDYLLEKLKKMSEYKPDYYKTACKAETNEEVIRLLNLYALENYDIKLENKIAAIPIGAQWKAVRASVLELGSPFMFASISNVSATAAGQIEYKKFKKILDLLK